MIAIFLEAWLQSSPWPRRLDIRHRILAQFEAVNQVADALRRAADDHAPSAHPRGVSCRPLLALLALVAVAAGEGREPINPFDADRTP